MPRDFQCLQKFVEPIPLLNEYKKQERIVFTVEEIAELIIEGINQIELKGKDPAQFEKLSDQIISSDPDVICYILGSFYGLESKMANAAFEAAATGHLVIIQMDQPSCEDAVNFLKRNVKYPVEQLEELIVGVCCQKLIEVDGKIKAVYDFKNLLES